MADTRIETDTFGPIEVPADRYWGAQTERLRRNFRIGAELMPSPVIRALVEEPEFAVHFGGNALDEGKRRAHAIITAAEEIISGTLDGHFPPGRLADRLRHPVQHECKRGDRQSRQ